MSCAFKPGTFFNAHAPTLRVKKTLTTLLVLACGLSLDISQAQTSEEPLEEIIVSGEYAGPGMWQITHPDHPGHTLWIVGEPPLLPMGMHFRSEKVTRVASQSQEILAADGIRAETRRKGRRVPHAHPGAGSDEAAQESRQGHAAGSAPARRLRALAGAEEPLPRSRLGCGENAALPGGRKTARCGDQGIAARQWRVLGRRLADREREEDSRHEPLPRIHLQDG